MPSFQGPKNDEDRRLEDREDQEDKGDREEQEDPGGPGEPRFLNPILFDSKVIV